MAEQHQWTPGELQALAVLGLSITPHSDPAHGWGYTWQGRDWAGPFTSPDAAIHAAFTEALLALKFRSAAPFTQQVGELWRWDGQESGWVCVGSPGTEEAMTQYKVALWQSALSPLVSVKEIDVLAEDAKAAATLALQGYEKLSMAVVVVMSATQQETFYDVQLQSGQNALVYSRTAVSPRFTDKPFTWGGTDG